MVRQSQRERRTPEERESVGGTGGIDLIGEDLLQNILSRLPALTFASAACVSRSWNTLCNRVLSLPKLSSAFSLNPSLQVAVEVVVDKVLSEPLRPHFAIACISPTFNLRLAHKLITEKLGSTTPVVTYESMGIMGRNALTNEFKEVQWDLMQEDPGYRTSGGILLVVGFVPGLKVDAVPLMQSNDPLFPLVDKFVMDIRHYTASVSDCSSPAGIIMFGAPGIDMKPVLEKMDYAMAMETVIVGDESGHFLHRGQDDMQNTNTDNCNSSGVALLFVRDRNKPDGIGEIEFCVTSSTGLSPIGPTFKAAAVREGREDCSTWLSARREEQPGIVDGNTMLDDINDEIGDRIEYPFLYIGVKKRRKCCVGLEKERWVTSLAFYEVTEGDEEYLYLRGRGIRTRDSFRFYYSDSSIASSSCTKVTENLRRLKQDWDNKVCHDARGDVARGKKKEVFGGIIFSCCGRGESFFGRPNVDSSPFLENFPGVPLAGTFCCGEIGRGSSSLYDEEAEEQSDLRCCLHVYSSFCLVMSYTPARCQCR